MRECLVLMPWQMAKLLRMSWKLSRKKCCWWELVIWILSAPIALWSSWCCDSPLMKKRKKKCVLELWGPAGRHQSSAPELWFEWSYLILTVNKLKSYSTCVTTIKSSCSCWKVLLSAFNCDSNGHTVGFDLSFRARTIGKWAAQVPQGFAFLGFDCYEYSACNQQKYDADQKVELDEYLMEAMMCMLVPHTHSLTDEVCKPVRSQQIHQ